MVEGSSGNDYSEMEEARLARNLTEISYRIHSGSLRNYDPSPDLLCLIHGELFKGVRSHAGKIRRRGYGSSYLTFGPHRSSENTVVPDQLLDLFEEITKAVRSFEANPEDPDYEFKAIQLGAWAHAKLIRIHPFQDGNGRSCRAFMNWLLVRLGLRPIAVDAVKQEYLACLNHFHVSNDIGPLLDLYIRLYRIP